MAMRCYWKTRRTLCDGVGERKHRLIAPSYKDERRGGKSLVMKRGLCVLGIALVATGCATFSKNGQSVREIRAVLVQWKDAILADDLERVLALYSEDLRTTDNGKPGLVEEMTSAVARVKRQDGRIDIEDATISVDGNRASALPVTIATRTGAITRRLDFEKRNGQWLIVGMPKK
jgi:ketosteroid isomerase-like protein